MKRERNNAPYGDEGQKNDGVSNDGAAQCSVRHERRLDVVLHQRQPCNVRILKTPHHPAQITCTVSVCTTLFSERTGLQEERISHLQARCSKFLT